jgi:DNA-binding Xre family transcriptional regulator
VPTAGVASTVWPIYLKGHFERPGTPHDVVVTQQETSDEQLRTSIEESIRQQYLLAATQGKISKIRAYRVFRRMDQVDLASRAGMTQPEISRAERLGQVRRMKGETLRRIARALQVRIDDLF